MYAHKRLTRIASAVLALGVTFAIAAPVTAGARAHWSEAECVQSALEPMDNSGLSGEGTLCRDSTGVQAQVEVSHLTPGDVYTVWFVYFDNPADCHTLPCQSVDATGENPAGVLGRMDSIIAPPSGEAHFSGQVRGLKLSPGSEFHLPVFTHGAANTGDGRALARQLLTPQVPGLGTPGLGIGADGRLGFPRAAARFDVP